MTITIKLRQGQIWRQGEDYLRIVRLERLEVEYKSTITLDAKKGTHHRVSKKEFCRLLKKATLLLPAETTPAAVVAELAQFHHCAASSQGHFF
jgi:hypothetical protein